jgi:sec-independent protein translocase protein TatC
MDDPIDRARAAVKDRAELPGMSLMEHLEELRKRLIHVLIYLLIGFAVAYAFHERLYGYIQKPLDDQGILLNYTHPTDPLNLYLKTAFVGGFILASPFILYQVWLFISPGMYAHEKRYVWPFMGATVGLGITFELPILIFFLALFGIVDGKFLIKHIRYAVLAIFLIAAIICPVPDAISMCVFASPMLVLYLIGVGVAFLVHPDRRRRKEKIAA